MKKAVSYQPLLREFQKLKFDSNYLEGLLSKPRTLPPIFEGMKVVNMGNIHAENTLIVIANPTCAACRRYHKALKRHLEHITNLHVQIILAASLQDEGIAGKVAREILDLPANEMEEALSDWFETKESQYDAWQQRTGGDYQSERATNQLIMQNRWLELAGVMQAPTSFLNRIELPQFYHPHELPRLCAYFSQLRNRSIQIV